MSYFSQPSQELVINENDDVLFVGKNIILQWTIGKYDGRKTSYTHTITDEKYLSISSRYENDINKIDDEIIKLGVDKTEKIKNLDML
jgi:hypothetical protein